MPAYSGHMEAHTNSNAHMLEIGVLLGSALLLVCPPYATPFCREQEVSLLVLVVIVHKVYTLYLMEQ